MDEPELQPVVVHQQDLVAILHSLTEHSPDPYLVGEMLEEYGEELPEEDRQILADFVAEWKGLKASA